MPPKTRRRDAGQGSLFYDESSGLYTARVELPSVAGVRRRKVVRAKTKQEAQRKLRALLSELDRSGDLASSSPTVAAWSGQWLDRIAAQRLKPSTLETYRGYVARYIVPSIGKVRLDKLTAGHVAKMHAAMTEQGLSSTTVLQAHRILTKCLVDAAREGRVQRVVSDREHMDAPRRAAKVRPSLLAADARALLVSVEHDDELWLNWSLALLAGLRQGERLGLTTSMVNLETGTITVSRQLQRLAWQHGCRLPGRSLDDWRPACGNARAASCPERRVGIPADQEATRVYGGLWLTRPKSRTGWREVPLYRDVRNRLADWMDSHPAGPEGLILLHDGRPMDPRQDAARWDASLRAAGLPDVPLHSARHTCATLLDDLGADEATRMQILGHSSATVTRGYTHRTSRAAQGGIDALGGLLLPRRAIES